MSKIIIYGGSFSPPTKGHFEVVKLAASQIKDFDNFYVYIGEKPRDGVTQDQSLKIWELYKKYLPSNIEFKPSKAPIGDIIRFIKNNPEEEIVWVLGAREGREDDEQDIKNRTDRFKDKLPNLKIEIIRTSNNKMSGSNARKELLNNNFEGFKKYLPENLSSEEQQQVWNILNKETINEVSGYEIKYWALYYHIFQQLKDNPEEVYNKLSQTLEGEELHALNYFYNTYFDEGKLNLTEGYNLDIPKFNYKKTLPQKILYSLKEIKLSTTNSLPIKGDLTGGEFSVGNLTYKYSIKNIPNPYKDEGLFYNIQFHPEEQVISTPTSTINPRDYIKILSTIYKIIKNFLEKEQPKYLGISSLDNPLGKNYHTLYANLTDNKHNQIPGYFRKDVNLPFNSPEGKGRFVVLQKSKHLTEELQPVPKEKKWWGKKGDEWSLKDILPNTSDETQIVMGVRNYSPKYYKVKEIDKDLLIPSQPTVIADKVKSISKDRPDELPEVAFYNGKYYIIDGHHRISALVLNGDSKIKVKIYFYKDTSEGVRQVPYSKDLLNENATYSKDINYKKCIKDLAKFYKQKYPDLEGLPKVRFIHGDQNNAKHLHTTTGYYDPNTKTIVIYTEGRHPRDIISTFSHEFYHWIQDMEGRLNNITSQNTYEDDSLDKIEREAYEEGNITFRNWKDSIKEYIEPADETKVDPKELQMGIEVEMEHTTNPKESKRIALQHLAEDPKYYSKLKTLNLEVISPSEAYTDEGALQTLINKKRDIGYFSSHVQPSFISTQNLGDLKVLKLKNHPYDGTIVYRKGAEKQVQELKTLIEKYQGFLPACEPCDEEDLKLYKAQSIEELEKDIYRIGQLLGYRDHEIMNSPNRLKEFIFPEGKKKDPFGLLAYAHELSRGLEEILINEGIYDSITNKISSEIFSIFKKDWRNKKIKSEFLNDYYIKDKKGRDLEVTVEALMIFKENTKYMKEGGAYPEEGIIEIIMVIDPNNLPEKWKEISMDLKDLIRHELEHLTQSGTNHRQGKDFEDDSHMRFAINNFENIPYSKYFTLDKEVDAMLQGLYFKAKKMKKPFWDVVKQDLDTFEELTPKDKEEIIKHWKNRAGALSLPLNEATNMEYKIYCDLDGCLVDFDKRFIGYFGMLPHEFEKKYGKDKFWEVIHEKGVGFWVGIEWMEDGKELWNYIKKYKPELLSSPSKEEVSKLGKRLWVRNNLPGVKLNLKFSAYKHEMSGENKILIDDRADIIQRWNDAGGIGIHHTSTKNTISKLKELGI